MHVKNVTCKGVTGGVNTATGHDSSNVPENVKTYNQMNVTNNEKVEIKKISAV